MQKPHRLNASVWLSFFTIIALIYLSWAIYDDELNHASEFLSGNQLWAAVIVFLVIASLNGVVYMLHIMRAKEHGEAVNRLATQLILLIVIGIIIGPSIAYFAVSKAKEHSAESETIRQLCAHSDAPNLAFCGE